MAFLLLLAATLPVWLTLGTTTIAETSAAPEQLIAGFAAAQNPDAFFYAINRAAAGDVASVRKAALARISDNDPKTRYAALYALALSADEGNADALAEFLTSPVADERLLAAGAMAGIRDKRALPVLIAALDQNEPLLYRGAGERVYSFARKQLLWFTGQTSDSKQQRRRSRSRRPSRLGRDGGELTAIRCISTRRTSGSCHEMAWRDRYDDCVLLLRAIGARRGRWDDRCCR